MRKRDVFLLGLLFGLLLLLMGVTYSIQQTQHAMYYLLRSAAHEDADLLLLTGSEGNFANKPSGAVQIPASVSEGASAINAIQVVFCGGTANNDTFTYKLYLWRKGNGPAELAATGTGTIGAQDVVLYPHNNQAATSIWWADTLTVTSRWVKTVSTTDSSGNNEIAKLVFDGCGYEWMWVEITSADSSTPGEAGSVSAYYSYF